MLPTIKIGGLKVTRLIIGGNPFAGFSHQSPERDREMVDFHTVAQIKETLHRAEAAGINSAVLRCDSHTRRMLREYWNESGAIQWIAQVGYPHPTALANIDEAVGAGAKAAFIHGGIVDGWFMARDTAALRGAIGRIQEHGIPAGVAGHAPATHRWVRDQDMGLDFHMVCFYDCGSVHAGRGERFDPGDPPVAAALIGELSVPCLAYKVLGAGRVAAREAFEFALTNIKPTDAVVAGMYRGDNDGMVEENAQLVAEILEAQAVS